MIACQGRRACLDSTNLSARASSAPDLAPATNLPLDRLSLGRNPQLDGEGKREAVTDKEIALLFYDAIGSFPAEVRESAQEWLAKRELAFQLVKKLKEEAPAVASDPVQGGSPPLARSG